MVFGQPIYNTEQRRAILQQYKDYIDKLRRKKSLTSWDEVEKEQKVKTNKRKRDNYLSKNKRKRRSKITLAKLKKLLCNDQYIK